MSVVALPPAILKVFGRDFGGVSSILTRASLQFEKRLKFSINPRIFSVFFEPK